MTKDNLLSHLVKLWYHTEDCPPQHAFNAGQNLKSGFQKSGLFPFDPQVIRTTVKVRHCPDSPMTTAESAAKDYQSSFENLVQTLNAEFGITEEKDQHDVMEYIKLKQRGVTPGAVLASSLQASLFAAAPKKARREKNEHLNLDAGGLTHEEIFQSEQAKKRADVKAKNATKAANRKAKASRVEQQEDLTAPVVVPKRKPRSGKRKTSGQS